jgi:hypothetical protein
LNVEVSEMFYGRNSRLALIMVDVLKRFEAAQNGLKVIRNWAIFILIFMSVVIWFVSVGYLV